MRVSLLKKNTDSKAVDVMFTVFFLFLHHLRHLTRRPVMDDQLGRVGRLYYKPVVTDTTKVSQFHPLS